MRQSGVQRVFYVDASPYGMAVVDEDGNTRWSAAPASGHSIMDEVHAISRALEWIAEDRVERALILCDNTSAVKSMYAVGEGKGPTGLAALAERVRDDLGAHIVAWVPRQLNAAANAAARRTVGGRDPADV